MAKMKTRRLVILAGALALTLTAVAHINQMDQADDPSLPEAALSQAAGEHSRAARARTETSPRPVDDAARLLNAPDNRYAKAARDVFSAKNPQRRTPAPPPQAVSEPAPTAPPLPFTYVGKMVDGNRLTIYIASPDRNYAVTAGDVIDGTYRVEEAQDSQLVFTYLPLNIRQTISIGDAK